MKQRPPDNALFEYSDGSDSLTAFTQGSGQSALNQVTVAAPLNLVAPRRPTAEALPYAAGPKPVSPIRETPLFALRRTALPELPRIHHKISH